MGVDLEVKASFFRERRGELLPTASLRFDRDPRILGQFDRHATPCLVTPLGGETKIGHYADQGLVFTDKDRYGNELTFTTSAQVKKLKIPEDVAPWNAAVLTFLVSLPPDSKIVLYWC